MSRPISESLSLLSETLGNCKINLKEKEVADVDNIKISDVDEKIAEIKAGGGNETTLNFLEYYEVDGEKFYSSAKRLTSDGYGTQNIKFKTNNNFASMEVFADIQEGEWNFQPPLTDQNIKQGGYIEPNTEYTVTCKQYGNGSEQILFYHMYNYKADFFSVTSFSV